MVDVVKALQRLQQVGGLKIPWGIYPGSYPGGQIREFTEQGWERYSWNPPSSFSESGIDEEASPKPTWNDLLFAELEEEIELLREQALRDLRRECSDRITRAYGKDEWSDEIEMRLRGGHTQEQDVERDRLRDRYKVIREWLKGDTRTLKELENLALEDDYEWSKGEWVPPSSIAPRGVPENLRASYVGKGSIVVEWDRMLDARMYEIRIKRNWKQGVWSDWIDTERDTEAVITNLVGDEEYFFEVRGVSGGGPGRRSVVGAIASWWVAELEMWVSSEVEIT